MWTVGGRVGVRVGVRVRVVVVVVVGVGVGVVVVVVVGVGLGFGVGVGLLGGSWASPGRLGAPSWCSWAVFFGFPWFFLGFVWFSWLGELRRAPGPFSWALGLGPCVVLRGSVLAFSLPFCLGINLV